MERGLNGVSPWQGPALPEPWCGPRLSRSTVSPLGTALEARGRAWQARPLGGPAYPFVVGEALGVKGRRDAAVRAPRARLGSGVNEQGLRDGRGRGASAAEGTGAAMGAGLQRRGGRGGEGLVSAAPAGRVTAAPR
jgi:putative transposase